MGQSSVTIIGTGALGAALAKALHDSNYPVTSLFNRRLRKAEALSREVDAQYCSEFPETLKELGSIVFITVRDSEIKNTVQKLSRIANDFTGYTVIHCSGSKVADVLNPVQSKGARIAAFHPLQTFTEGSGARDFRNIYFDVEADEGTYDLLNDLANSLGAETIEISAEAKPYLHAAAVMASNYLVTLLDLSGKAAGLGGLNNHEALHAMLPLVQKSLQNVESRGTVKALTGPIRRGDAETVRLHIDLLSGNKNLLSTYKKLGLETLEIAVKEEMISSQKKRELNNLLKEHE